MHLRKKLVLFFLLVVKSSFSQGLFVEHSSPCDSTAKSSIYAYGLDSGLVSSQFSLKLTGNNLSNVSVNVSNSDLPYQNANFNVIGDSAVLHSWFSFNLQPFTSTLDTLLLFQLEYSAWPDSIFFTSTPLVTEFIDKDYSTYSLSLASAVIETCDSISNLSIDYGTCLNGVKQLDTLIIVPSILDTGKIITFGGNSHNLQLPETKILIDTSIVLIGDTLLNYVSCTNCLANFSYEIYNPTFCSSSGSTSLSMINAISCDGDSIETVIVFENDTELTGFQFALNYEFASSDILNAIVQSPAIASWGLGNYNISNDSIIRLSWFSITPNAFNNGDTLVVIRFSNSNSSENSAAIDSTIMTVEFLNNTSNLIPGSVEDSIINCLDIGCSFNSSQCLNQSRSDSVTVRVNNSFFSFIYCNGSKVGISNGLSHTVVTSSFLEDTISFFTDTLANGDFLFNEFRLPALNCDSITLEHLPETYACNVSQTGDIFITGITDTVSIDISVFLNPSVGQYITHSNGSNVISNKVSDSLYFSLIAYPDDTVFIGELQFRYIDSGSFVSFGTTEINSINYSFASIVSSDFKSTGCDNTVEIGSDHQITPCYSGSRIFLSNAMNISSFQLALKIQGLHAKIDSIDPKGYVSNLIGDSLWLVSGINTNTTDDTLVLGNIYWSGLDSSSLIFYSLDSSVLSTEVIRNNMLQSVNADLDTISFETSLPMIKPLFSGTGICFGDSLKLESNYSAYDSLLWSNGSTQEFLWINDNGLIVLYAYYNSCVDTLVYGENRFDSCDVQIQYAKSVLCPGDSIELSLASIYTSYLWSNGSSAPSIYVSSVGNYSVQVVDNNGSTLTSGTVNISVFSVQSPILSPANNLEICFEDSLKLSISPPIGSVLWSDGEFGFENWIDTAGMYYAIVTDDNNCESVSDSITLTKRSFPLQGSRNLSGCDSLEYEDSWITSDISFLDTTSTILGCDSAFLVTIYLLQSSSVVDSIISCGQHKWINGITYTENNFTATYSLNNTSGCDSLIRLHLEILPDKFSFDEITACSSYTWMDGNTYTSSTNTATMNLTATNGCDSVVTLDLTINTPVSSTDVITTCGSYTWIDGNTYTTSNTTATTTLTASNGCDSVVTLNLTINTSFTGTDIITTCGSYTWIDGNTYTISNYLATDTLISSGGCDSIVYLNLTIVQNISGIDQITSCGSYTWIDGNTYTTSNTTASSTLTATNGCDSVVTLDLTINAPSSSTDVITSCDNYTWINGTTYIASNNSDFVVLIDQNGCDSIVYIDLIIVNSNSTIDSVEACNSYTWLNGTTYLTSNNNAAVTFLGQNGCDSVVYLNLNIYNINSMVTISGDTLVAQANQTKYQWLECNQGNYSLINGATQNTYVPNSTGEYAVSIKNGTCADTSACLFYSGLNIIGNDRSFSVFPNPTRGKLKIYSQSGFNQVHIYNSDGKEIIELRFNEDKSEIALDLDGLQSGLYSMKAIGKYEVKTVKIVLSY